MMAAGTWRACASAADRRQASKEKRAVRARFFVSSCQKKLLDQRRGKSFQPEARAFATTVCASRPMNKMLKIATIVMISHMA
jgi:hypothetical protein